MVKVGNMRWKIINLTDKDIELIKVVGIYHENKDEIIRAIINDWASVSCDIFKLVAQITILRQDVKKAVDCLCKKNFICKDNYSGNRYNCNFRYCYYDNSGNHNYEFLKAVFEINSRDTDMDGNRTFHVEID